MTALLGFVQLTYPCGFHSTSLKTSRPLARTLMSKSPRFWTTLAVIGCLRFMTVLFGLFALNSVAVSFAETVKSSAPIFTVVISWVVVQEKTTWPVLVSIVPIMAGLALCSATEMTFEVWGFLSAAAANFTECLQNVWSKLLISGSGVKESYKFT
jgi:solute carrier family 35 protein E2